jgi:hypothetical protein
LDSNKLGVYVCLLVSLLALYTGHTTSSTRYKARWSVEFGKSTQSDAPVDPNSGCGPEPFDSTTVEFERFWEVVEAEY